MLPGRVKIWNLTGITQHVIQRWREKRGIPVKALLKNKDGAGLKVIRSGGSQHKIVAITAYYENKKGKKGDLRLGSSHFAAPPKVERDLTDEELVIQIPSSQVGQVIGASGLIIKTIVGLSGCKDIKISESHTGSHDVKFIGKKQSIQNAHKFVLRVLEEGPSFLTNARDRYRFDKSQIDLVMSTIEELKSAGVQCFIRINKSKTVELSGRLVAVDDAYHLLRRNVPSLRPCRAPVASNGAETDVTIPTKKGTGEDDRGIIITATTANSGSSAIEGESASVPIYP